MTVDRRLDRANKELDEEIAALRQQVALAKKRRQRQPAAVEAVNGAAPSGDGQDVAAQSAVAAPVQETIPTQQGSSEQNSSEELLDIERRELVVEHVTQIKTWLNTERELIPMVAKFVGEVEGKYERRNLMLNVVLSTIFLIAGWLLSIIATPSLSHVLGH